MVNRDHQYQDTCIRHLQLPFPAQFCHNLIFMLPIQQNISRWTFDLFFGLFTCEGSGRALMLQGPKYYSVHKKQQTEFWDFVVLSDIDCFRSLQKLPRWLFFCQKTAVNKGQRKRGPSLFTRHRQIWILPFISANECADPHKKIIKILFKASPLHFSFVHLMLSWLLSLTGKKNQLNLLKHALICISSQSCTDW